MISCSLEDLEYTYKCMVTPTYTALFMASWVENSTFHSAMRYRNVFAETLATMVWTQSRPPKAPHEVCRQTRLRPPPD